MDNELDKFGRFVISNLRDASLFKASQLVSGENKAPSLVELQNKLGKLNSEQKLLFLEAMRKVIDSGLNDFLFAIEEQSESHGSMTVSVDGQNVTELSDGLNGELFAEDGWISRFSDYE